MMKSILTIESNSEKQTMQLAGELAKNIQPGHIICLCGDLGAGKTTFVKGFAQALKVKSIVNSPTFVFLNIYEGKMPIYHFDLYRIDNLNQLPAIGFDEFCYGNGICLIEWADKLEQLIPKEHLLIALEHKGQNKREIRLSAHGELYEGLLERINLNRGQPPASPFNKERK